MEGRYDQQERDIAVKKAKELDKLKSNTAVKVVKETYDPETDSNSEVTVYKSAGSGIESAAKKGGGSGSKKPAKKETTKKKDKPKESAPSSSSAPAGSGAAQTQAAHNQAVAQQAAKNAGKGGSSSSLGLIGKVLFIIVFSVAIGALLSGVGSIIVRKTTLLSGLISHGSYGTLLFSVFVLAFLFTGIVSSMLFIKREDLSAMSDEGQSRQGDHQSDGREKAKTFYESAAGRAADEGQPNDGDGEALPEDEEDEEAFSYDPEANERAELDAAAEEIKEVVKAESPKMTKLRDDLGAFLAEGIAEIQAANVRMDKFNKFGLSLFLAGACDAMGIEEGLNHGDRNKVLSDLITMLGISKGQADKFAIAYDSYLATDSRYLTVFKSGIDAMRSRIRTTEGASVGLLMKNALDEWNKPKPRDTQKGPITVMFTDMVGSTALNQEKGDAVAQEVVRQHNKIVRSALTLYGGKEIKHMGDGIMASFAVSSSGVEAAVEIQKQILQETADDEEKMLQVRIGLNAGELIVEDNDLFGTTVQLAARICDRADTGEVFISEIIHGICAGTGMDFHDEGKYALKGINKPMTLYSVVFDEHAEERREKRRAKESSEVGGKGKRVTEGDEEEAETGAETKEDEKKEDEGEKKPATPPTPSSPVTEAEKPE